MTKKKAGKKEKKGVFGKLGGMLGARRDSGIIGGRRDSKINKTIITKMNSNMSITSNNSVNS